jgi:hypothetical protein
MLTSTEGRHGSATTGARAAPPVAASQRLQNPATRQILAILPP